MGKTTGFMDYERSEIALRDAQERASDWDEIKQPATPFARQLRTQAARCMDCGTPFCHSGIVTGKMVSGCPLHNLMPEFNEMVCSSMDDRAYARLSMTNNFPEFTSHVCPAPCEGACNAGLAGSPVTIRAIEQYIAEYAFSSGLVKPFVPAVRTGKKVAVIGSGPAGLACADQLNRAGHLVTVFERDDRAGGLLMYGIPNMKLDKKTVERRIAIMEQSGIRFALRSEIGVNIASAAIMKEYDAVVLCTGATKPRDLDVDGRGLKGIHFAKDYLAAITKSMLDSGFADGRALSAKDKDVVIIGGGDTGNDCVASVIRQGCRSVKQLQHNPCPPRTRAADNPWPQYPRVFTTDYGHEEAIARFGEDPREFCISTKGFTGKSGRVSGVLVCQNRPVEMNGRRAKIEVPGTERVLPAQMVLLAMGYAGSEQKIIDEFGVTRAPGGSIAADDRTYMTSVEGVFAAGDARRGQSLVVWAIAEGRRAAASVSAYLAHEQGAQK